MLGDPALSTLSQGVTSTNVEGRKINNGVFSVFNPNHGKKCESRHVSYNLVEE